jgi:hypothetical protein
MMKLLRDFGIPLVALLVLLALLLAVLIIIYDQNGIFLPFAVQPEETDADTAVCIPDNDEYKTNILFLNWRLLQ